MKTHTLEALFPPRSLDHQSSGVKAWIQVTQRWTLSLLAMLAPIATVSVLTAWAISFGAEQIVAAIFWTSGFLLLALAIESEGRTSTMAWVSALLTMLFAWLASRYAADFALLAGLVVSGWLAHGCAAALETLSGNSR